MGRNNHIQISPLVDFGWSLESFTTDEPPTVKVTIFSHCIIGFAACDVDNIFFTQEAVFYWWIN